jgi:hypothetical protein
MKDVTVRRILCPIVVGTDTNLRVKRPEQAVDYTRFVDCGNEP